MYCDFWIVWEKTYEDKILRRKSLKRKDEKMVIWKLILIIANNKENTACIAGYLVNKVFYCNGNILKTFLIISHVNVAHFDLLFLTI